MSYTTPSVPPWRTPWIGRPLEDVVPIAPVRSLQELAHLYAATYLDLRPEPKRR